jgi:hypothetical protein
MSAVLQFPQIQSGDVYLELHPEVFDDFYGERAAALYLDRSHFYPSVHCAVQLVEVAAGTPTGREVYGTVTAIHSISQSLIVTHFRHTGRTWNMRDECLAHPEQNARARRYFGFEQAPA